MSVAWPGYAVEVKIPVQQASSLGETLHRDVSNKNVHTLKRSLRWHRPQFRKTPMAIHPWIRKNPVVRYAKAGILDKTLCF